MVLRKKIDNKAVWTWEELCVCMWGMHRIKINYMYICVCMCVVYVCGIYMKMAPEAS